MKIVFIMLLCSGVLCSFLSSAEKGNPEIICHRIKNPPEIDGFLREDVWKQGRFLEGFHQLGESGVPARLPSIAVVLHDEKKLYIAMLMGKTSDRSLAESIWQDGVEVFIDPGRTLSTYFQIAGNTAATWSAVYREGRARDETWDPGIEFSAREVAFGWVMEMSIPFSSMGIVPEEGDVWGMNICRNDSLAGLMTLAPLSGFHNPSGFYKVLFAGSGEPHDIDSFAVEKRAAVEMLEEMKGKIESHSGKSPAVEALESRIMDSIEVGESIEEAVVENSAFAGFYSAWAYSKFLTSIEEKVYWRLRTVRLFDD